MPAELTTDPASKTATKSSRTGALLPEDKGLSQTGAPADTANVPQSAVSAAIRTENPSPAFSPVPAENSALRSSPITPNLRAWPGSNARSSQSSLPPAIDHPNNLPRFGFSSSDDNLFTPPSEDEDNLFNARHRSGSVAARRVESAELPRVSRVPVRYRRGGQKQHVHLIPAIPLAVKLLLLAMRVVGIAPARPRLK